MTGEIKLNSLNILHISDAHIQLDAKEEVSEIVVKMINDDKKPIYVAVNGSGICVGYAFCQLQEQSVSNNTVPFKSLYIDDLCVDKEQRGKHIGEALFDYVKKEAKRMDCCEVTLNVWTGNTPAEKFYEKMGLKTKKRMMEYIL